MCQALHAQDLTFTWLSQATSQQQLPSDAVTALARDNSGSVWVGTVAGLASYDGLKFKQHVLDDVDFGRVYALAIRQQRWLWVGHSRGLSIYDLHTGDWLEQSHPILSGLISDFDRVYEIHIDPQQGVWLGTDQGAIYIDIDGKRARTESREEVYALQSTQSHNVFIIGPTGVYTWNPKEKGRRLLNIPIKSSRAAVGAILPSNAHDQYWFAGDGNQLLLATEAGRIKQRIELEAVDAVTVLMSDQDEQLWVGSLGKGLWHVLPDQVKAIKDPDINRYNVITGLLDQQGGVLIGTSGHGLGMLDRRQYGFGFYLNALSCLPTGDAIHAIVDGGDGSVFVTQVKVGVTHYYPELNRCERISTGDRYLQSQLDEGRIWSMFRSGHSVLVPIGTEQLLEIDINSNQVNSFNPFINAVNNESISAINQDASQRIWLGGDRGGLYYWDQSEHQVITDGVFHEAMLQRFGLEASWTIYGIVSIDQQTLIISTPLGLVFYDLGTARLRVVHHPDGDTPHILALDNQQKIWVGSKTSGVWILDSNGTFLKTLSEDDGLPDNWVASLTFDQNNRMWVATDGGLAVVSSTGEMVKRYGDNKLGSVGNFMFTATPIPNGDIAFGGENFIASISPEHLLAENFASPVARLTEFRLLNKTIKPGPSSPLQSTLAYNDKIVLKHDQRMFSIGFSAEDARYAAGLYYRYRLDGFDDDWVYTSAEQPLATYTNLDPGHYQFQVEASFDGLAWEGRHATQLLRVKPPFWLTWWAYCLYGLMTIMAFITYARVRTMALQKYTTQLEQDVKTRTYEISEQKHTIESLLDHKNKVFAHVSHELRTPLTLLLSPLEKLSQEANSEHKGLFDLAKRNGFRLVRTVEQLLELARLDGQTEPPVGIMELNPALDFIFRSFEAVVEIKRQSIRFQPGKPCFVQITDDALTKIVSNLFSNAIKYTPAGGNIVLSTRCINEHKVELVFEDDGCGIPKEAHEWIFERFRRVHSDQVGKHSGVGLGLALVKELVETYGGRVYLDTDMREGSRFVIELLQANVAQQKRLEPQAGVGPNTALNIEVDNLQPESEVPLVLSDAKIQPDTAQEQVLIVDDHPELCQYVASVLGDLYDCQIALDGEQGIQQAIKTIPDVIITDLMMPGKDGLELVKILREDHRTCHIPMILLSAKGNVETRIRGLENLVDEYMTKPFAADELKARVANLIELRNILRNRWTGDAKQADQDQQPQMSPRDAKLVNRLETVIADRLGDPALSTEDLANATALSERQLLRKTRALFGCKPKEYLREIRLREAAKLLLEGCNPNEVSYMVGFSYPSYFSRCFKARYGVSPSDYYSNDG